MRWLSIVLCACGHPAAEPPHNVAPPVPVAVEPTPQECVSRVVQLAPPSDEVLGDLDKTGIRHVVAEHIGELQACYARYLTRGSEAGQVLAIFTVHRGQVTRAETRGFDDELDRCVCRVVASLVFPKFDAVINYPFTFRPAG